MLVFLWSSKGEGVQGEGIDDANRLQKNNLCFFSYSLVEGKEEELLKVMVTYAIS